MQISVSSNTPSAVTSNVQARPTDLKRPVSAAQINGGDTDAQRLQAMAERGGKVVDIVNRYNLRSISYTDLQAMTKELMDVGALKESEMLDFLPPSNEFSGFYGSRNPNWNAPKDYIGLVVQQITAQENGFATDERSLKYLKSRLELMRRFVQPGPTTLGS